MRQSTFVWFGSVQFGSVQSRCVDMNRALLGIPPQKCWRNGTHCRVFTVLQAQPCTCPRIVWSMPLHCPKLTRFYVPDDYLILVTLHEWTVIIICIFYYTAPDLKADPTRNGQTTSKKVATCYSCHWWMPTDSLRTELAGHHWYGIQS